MDSCLPQVDVESRLDPRVSSFRYGPRRARGVAAWVAVAWCVAGASPPKVAAAEQGLLLLSNGNLLAGRIQRTGESYQVDRTGSVLTVPARQVLAVCRSAAEAYQVQRQRTYDDAAGHVMLARWCLRNELWEQAASELLMARSQDPRAPGLQLAERQLTAILQRHDSQAARTAAATAAEPQQSPPVVADPNPRASQRTLEHPPPIAPSVAAQAQFVRSVQPMLIHNCGTAGCHEQGGTLPMALDRMAIVGGGNAAAVQRNMQAVAALLDAEQPDTCRLVEWARRHHGPASTPATALTPRQAELLVEWARQAVGYEPPPEPEPVPTTEALTDAAAPDRLLPDAAPPLDTEDMLLSDAEVAAYKKLMTGGAASPAAAAVQPAVHTAAPPQPGQLDVGDILPCAPASQSRDPFDPAEFHRRIAQRRAHEADVPDQPPSTSESAAAN